MAARVAPNVGRKSAAPSAACFREHTIRNQHHYSADMEDVHINPVKHDGLRSGLAAFLVPPLRGTGRVCRG